MEAVWLQSFNTNATFWATNALSSTPNGDYALSTVCVNTLASSQIWGGQLRERSVKLKKKKGFWNTGSESLALLSIWTHQVGAQGMLHETSEDVVPLLSPFWLVINLAWGQLLSFHREPENLGSIWILERFTHSCCSTWAEARPLSCSLWTLFQISDCWALF